MVFSLVSYLQHRRDCQFKQAQRRQRIGALHFYRARLTDTDREILAQPIDELVTGVHKGTTRPFDILHAYGRVAFKAHKRTNCLTEILLPSAEKWLSDGSINLKGPLAGIPVSLKDTIVVGGYDTTVGYSSFVGNATPEGEDGAMVRMLKDAGAVPYVKTNLPITLLSFESSNDVWGRTTNPHNSAYTAGGSSGGESALLAMGGRIGVGSDVAGSVRLPAHWSGCYSLRCSTGRWPKLGIQTSMPGQEGVPSVYSPMARTLHDLTYFMRSIVEMKPWKYDPAAHPIPWRVEVEKQFSEKPAKKLRVGVLRTDGVVDPSPACARALSETATALRRAGHEVFDVHPPDMYEALQLASLLLNADGCSMFSSFMRSGEWLDRGAAQMYFYSRLPRPIKWLHYLWVRYVRQDPIWAGLLKGWHPKTAYENWHLVKRREAYRAKWFEWWNGAGVDCLITPPNATPALPHEGMRDAVSSCGYTFLFNLLDYTAGVIPVTHVDKTLDKLPAEFDFKKLNGVAQGAYKFYDAEKMHGLPVGVQVVGRRLEEEKVLAIMGRVEEALGDNKYKLMEID